MPDDHSLIFVSYSREDSAFALQLTRDLKSSGASVWLDQLDIPTGVRWDTEIEGALARCTAFLVILSPASVASENVRDEIDFAIGQRKKLIPILHTACIVPLRINRFQRVDFSKDYQSGLHALSQTLGPLPVSEQRETAIVSPVTPERQEAAVTAPAEPDRREATIAAPATPQRQEAAIAAPVEPEKREAVISAPAGPEKLEVAVVSPAGPWARTLWQITHPRNLPVPVLILILATVWQSLFGFQFRRLDDNAVGYSLSSFGLALVLAMRFFRPQLQWRLLASLALMWLIKAVAEQAWASNAFIVLYFALAFILSATITGSTVASALKQKKLKGASAALLSFGAPPDRVVGDTYPELEYSPANQLLCRNHPGVCHWLSFSLVPSRKA